MNIGLYETSTTYWGKGAKAKAEKHLKKLLKKGIKARIEVGTHWDYPKPTKSYKVISPFKTNRIL
jgi:hypothetical protein